MHQTNATIIRFEVRHAFRGVLTEQRSQDRATKLARDAARAESGAITLVRVERTGNLTRERLLESF